MPNEQTSIALSESQDVKGWYEGIEKENELVIIMYIRGIWCPFCAAHAKALAGIKEKVAQRGGKVLVISSQTSEKAEEMKARWGLPIEFDVIGDPDHKLLNFFRSWLSPVTTRVVGKGGDRVDSVVDYGSEEWRNNKYYSNYEHGATQPALYVVRSGKREVLFEWFIEPSSANYGGATDRPEIKDVWSQVEITLDGGEGKHNSAGLNLIKFQHEMPGSWWELTFKHDEWAFLVLVYYRGAWSPKCTEYLEEVKKLWPEIAGAGGIVLAVTAESQSSADKLKQDLVLPFEVLGDPRHSLLRFLRQKTGKTIAVIQGKGGDEGYDTAKDKDHNMFKFYEHGVAEPGLHFLRKDFVSGFSWNATPTSENGNGVIGRPSFANVWAAVRQRGKALHQAKERSGDAPRIGIVRQASGERLTA